MASSVNTWTLLRDLAKRDFKTRYLGSLLGSYWNLIHPLVMISIYTLIFSNVMKARLGGPSTSPYAYSLYLCSGLLAWTLMTEVIQRGTVSILENASFLRKLPISTVYMFIVTWMSALINFAIASSIFAIVLAFLQPESLWFFGEYLIVALLLSLFALGLGTTLGCLNVYLRDFQQMTSIVLQLWFWFTPIVYTVDVLPQFAKELLWFNPSFAFIEPMHQLLYHNTQPPAIFWLLMFAWISIAMGLAAFVHHRTRLQLRDFL